MTIRKIVSGLLVAAAAVCASTVGAVATGDFKSGNWTGYAVFNNNGFSLCRMSASYTNSYKLTFGISRTESVLIAISNSTWTLNNVGNEVSMRLQIDDLPALVRQARVIDKITVALNFTDSDYFYQRLRSGRSLRIAVGTASRSFSLQGTSAALNRLLTCVRTYK